MADSTGTAKNQFQNIQGQIGQTAKETLDNVKNAARDFGGKAQEFVSNATQRANEAGNFVDQKAEQATSAFGDHLKSAGEAVRQYGSRDGEVCQRSESIAQTLNSAGDYVKTHGIKGMEADLMALVKNNPIPALIMGIGLGFLAGRATTSRR